MDFIKNNYKGILLSVFIAVPCWFFGKLVPIVGAPVFAIVIGMILGLLIKDKSGFSGGLKFTSKKVLQWAVILLGFGLNLKVVAKTGLESLPIICATIATSLIVSFLLCKLLNIPSKISTLVGVGSSICGGSAVAATAPVIDADDEEIAQAISVIFFFNVLAALIFPWFGQWVGFSMENGEGFGVFAGTAVNDTSSVTACASSWDSIIESVHSTPAVSPEVAAQYANYSETLDKAVTVKLTRTLAIIPITLVLAFYYMAKAKKENGGEGENKFSFSKVFPFFIIWFILASLITTLCDAYVTDPQWAGYVKAAFGFLKTTSKFFIVLAMAAIGVNTDIVKLVKSGGKPLLMGAACWICITGVSLLMQHFLGIW